MSARNNITTSFQTETPMKCVSEKRGIRNDNKDY